MMRCKIIKKLLSDLFEVGKSKNEVKNLKFENIFFFPHDIREILHKERGAITEQNVYSSKRVFFTPLADQIDA